MEAVRKSKMFLGGVSPFTLLAFLLGLSFLFGFLVSPLGALVYSTFNPSYADPGRLVRLYNLFASQDVRAVWTELQGYMGHPVLLAFQDEVIVSAIRVSLVTTAISSAIGVCFGLPLAYVMARYNFPGKETLKTLIELPMVLPPTVAGISLILFLGPNTPLGSILARNGWDIIFTWRGIILAQTFVSFPFFARTAIASFEAVPESMELTARSLGASPFRAFYSVTLPMSARGLVAGWAMMWARAMGEFGATIMVSSNIPGQSYTLATAIYWKFWAGGIYQSIAAAVVLLMVAFTVLMAVRFFVEK
nr:molybdate ABC transporter permease subunit [Candidatus Bathyarchaeota archaeon]